MDSRPSREPRTKAELALLNLIRDEEPHQPGLYCNGCGEKWPCPDAKRAVTSEVVAEVRRLRLARVPPKVMCGVVSNSGPNGEPLACGYPANDPDKLMHAHSWATLPTFTLNSTEEEPHE